MREKIWDIRDCWTRGGIRVKNFDRRGFPAGQSCGRWAHVAYIPWLLNIRTAWIISSLWLAYRMKRRRVQHACSKLRRQTCLLPRASHAYRQTRHGLYYQRTSVRRTHLSPLNTSSPSWSIHPPAATPCQWNRTLPALGSTVIFSLFWPTFSSFTLPFFPPLDFDLVALDPCG